MTRSFDLRAMRREGAAFMALDCLCKNNDPACATCWEPWPPEYGKQEITAAVHKAFDAAVLSALPTPTSPLKQVTDVTSDFALDVRYRFEECEELLLRKHLAYGPSNIGNAPGGPLNGLQVRIHDKVARINNLIATGHTPESEPLRDSFLDLANYSIIALMVLDDRWPTE